MKVIECPQCKGSIRIDQSKVDQDIYTCEYCGTRVRYKVKSKGAVEARTRVKELEHEEAMADKQHNHEMEVMDKEYEQEVDREKRDNKSTARLFIGMAVAFCLLMGALAIMGFFQDNPGFSGGVNQAQVSKSARQMRGTNHEIIEEELRSLGFTNIDSEGLGDKGGFLDFATDGDVEYISINGDSEFKKNTWFSTDAKIIIKYHSYPDQ